MTPATAAGPHCAEQGAEQAAIDPLDDRLAAADLAIWIGAEPTFTRRESNDPWWLWQADPDLPGAEDKRRRAAQMATILGRRIRGAEVHRVIGRQYPDEEAPRFCFGVRAPRSAPPAGEPRTRGHDDDDDRDPAVDALLAAVPAATPVIGPDQLWLTVTADPGVVEVNTAPCPDLASFGGHLDDVWIAAASAGLSAYRWRYNGDEVDSGGGGQLTLGGPSPDASPFFRHPALLPRMIRYFANHPALSYWFLGECAGSASQSPRADEGVRERWEELRLACAWLEHEAHRGRVTPHTLWSSLAPLLVDAGGNSHRAEINVEKLWNPHLANRGKLGVVELRAFRMPRTPADMVAVAALVRAVAARCALAPYEAAIIDWGAELHDRWALPWFLAEDLDLVLDDLAAHDLPLERHQARLRGFRHHALGATRVGGFGIELSRALEFWPLVGDLASQERATARLVDASSERLELVADREGDAAITIRIAGHAVTPRVNVDGAWRYHVLGLRRRQFVPDPGLVPTLPADEPLRLAIEAGGEAVTMAWYAWRPGGGAYDGLPGDDAEADARRRERLIVTPSAAATVATTTPAAPATWTLDVRALHARPRDAEPSPP